MEWNRSRPDGMLTERLLGCLLTLAVVGCDDPFGDTDTDASTSSTSTSSGSSESGESSSGGSSSEGSSSEGSSSGGSSSGNAGSSSGSSTGAVSCTPGEGLACYDGRPGTQGVGLCSDGIAVCQADGTPGPCEGWVGPSFDACNTPEDEDCDGETPACTGNELWQRMIGSTGEEPWGRAKFSTLGEVHVVSYSTANDSFFPEPGNDVAGGPLHFARYGPDGTLLAAQSLPGGEAKDFAIDADGNTYVIGEITEPTDFGSGVGPDEGLYLLRLDPDGNLDWVQQYDEGFAYGPVDFFQAVYDPSSNTILATGTYTGEGVDLGTGPLIGQEEGYFLARFGTDGSTVDVDVGFNEVGRIAVNDAGMIAMAGDNGFEPALVVAGQVFETPALATHFVALVDADLELVQLHMTPGLSFTPSIDVAFAPDGTFWVVSDVGDTVPGSGTDAAPYVAHYDAMGQHLSHRALEGSAVPRNVHVGPSGLPVVVGEFSVGADIGTGPLTPDQGVFVAKYDVDLDPVWVREGTTMMGGPLSLDSVGVDAAGHILVSGTNSGDASIDLGGTPVTGYGTPADTFVGVLAP